MPAGNLEEFPKEVQEKYPMKFLEEIRMTLLKRSPIALLREYPDEHQEKLKTEFLKKKKQIMQELLKKFLRGPRRNLL